jgi:hypothetical protein
VQRPTGRPFGAIVMIPCHTSLDMITSNLNRGFDTAWGRSKSAFIFYDYGTVDQVLSDCALVDLCGMETCHYQSAAPDGEKSAGNFYFWCNVLGLDSTHSSILTMAPGHIPIAPD